MERKIELYREAQTHGREAGFIANVILCHHCNPTRKLAGLVVLLRRGISVSTASFDMDTLLFDGAGAHSYSELEAIARAAR